MWCGSVDLSEISCDEVLEEIELYLDGELDQQRSLQLAAHLGSCSPCLRRAEFQRRLKEIVRAKCHTDVPVYLSARIRATIRGERPPWRA
jgi:mycothiol system anti-sigma-R factor